MRLEPLYVARFHYPGAWAVDVGAGEQQHFFLAEGRVEGRLTGRLRGANHPKRRSDGTFEPDFQGVLETDDGAVVYFDWQGYGRAYPAGARQIVAFARHLSDDERYRWLNDAVCAAVGEVRGEPRPMELVLEVAELVWEPLGD